MTEYEDNYTATLAARTFRALAALIAAFDLEAHHFDAVNAFTNSPLEDVIHCNVPEGFGKPEECLRLLRALYGLRQSSRLWLQEFSHGLTELGMQPVTGIECLFTNNSLLLFFYVDDISVLYRRSNRVQFFEFRSTLMDRYKMRDLGELKWFLGIKIMRNRAQQKLWLCQDSYVSKIAASFHLEELIRYPNTPMTVENLENYSGKATSQEIYAYQRRVGSLLYATTITRPDATRTANKLSEFLQNLGPSHMEAVNRAIAYLYNTRFLALEYSKSNPNAVPFICSSDAAYADDSAT